MHKGYLGIEQPTQSTQIEETNSIYKEQSKTVNLSSRTTAQQNNQPTMGISTAVAEKERSENSNRKQYSQ
jgi:hypothetical protein